MFCRLCGAKLTFEDIETDIRKNIERKEHNRIFSKIFRVFLVIFIVFAFYLVYLIIDPFQSVRGTENIIPKDQQRMAITTMSTIDTGIKGSYILDLEQINFLAQKYFSTKTRPVSAGILDGKYITFSFYETVFDYHVKIVISKTAVLEPEITKNDKGNDVFSMRLKYIKFGKLPLPERANEFFSDDFRPFASNSRIARILRKIDDVKISADHIEIISK